MGEAKASRADVSRLFGRAAFGATAADLDKWTGQPYADVVAYLVDVPDPVIRPPAPDEAQRLAVEAGNAATNFAAGFAIETAQTWWLERMRATVYPLEERMTLHWHDHFATGPNEKGTGTAALMAQNQTLRRNALGNFRTMCTEITLDPAMLFWLDGAYNAVGATNENYAREFFELFTLGVIPQVYKERDIRESARALTGWQCDSVTRVVRFNEGLHDPDAKTVLGRKITNKGATEYLEIIDVALSQRVAPLFVAYKMVLNFAYVPETRDLIRAAGPLIAKIARTLVRTKWDLREAVRTMLLADEFRYADESRGRQVVRQPIELVVHACKALGISAGDAAANQILGRMGQRPFMPPNVGGWPFGKNWISPATFLARYDWGLIAHQLYANGLLKEALPAPDDLKAWIARFGLARLTRNTDAAIRSYLSKRAKAPPEELQTGVLALIVSSPDWMVM